jgi:hypothetical protein
MSAAVSATRSAAAEEGPASDTVSSAPRSGSSASRPGSRPAATTFRAPNIRDTCTASSPELPVAPRISTSCPARNSARYRSASHDDMAGFMAAATATGSVPGGSTTLRRTSIRVCSAIEPRVPSCRTKYRSCLSAPRPTPSMPGTSGSSPVDV